MARKIAVLTGARSDYGVLCGVIQSIDTRPDLLLRLVVTGSHLSETHGMTIREIESDGWDIAAQVPILDAQTTTSDLGVARTMGRAVDGNCRGLRSHQARHCAVSGRPLRDLRRGTGAEALRLPIAHIGGGECDHATCSTVISAMRSHTGTCPFCVLPDLRRASDRTWQDPWRVHIVGLPSLDDLKDGLLGTREMEAALGIPLRHPLILGPTFPSRSALRKAVMNWRPCWPHWRAGPMRRSS